MSFDQKALEIRDLCENLGIELKVEGDQLRVRCPRGTMTEELHNHIADNKAGLLLLLRCSDCSETESHSLQDAPLSFSQERLWFLDRFDGASTAFSLPLVLTLNGRLDRGALEDSVDDLVRRHNALRTVIAEHDGEPRQVVLQPRSGVVEWSDLAGTPDSTAAFRSLAFQTIETNFDLERGPLFRFLLVRLGEERHGLIMVMHHIVTDRASLGILCRDLSQLYFAKCKGETPSLATVTQFTDYCSWQREYLSKGHLDSELEKAVANLTGAPPLLTLPWDRQRPAVQTMQGGSHIFSVPPGLAEDIARLGRSCSATPYMIWLALFGLLLSRLADQRDVVLGCPVSSRRPETEDSVGFFVNTLVLRLSTAGEPSFLEYLQTVRDAARNSFRRRELPFELLVKRLQPERSFDRNPLFQAMFVLQSTPLTLLELPELNAEYLPLDIGVSEFDLNLTMEPRNGGYRCYLEYSTDLFDEATIQRWTGYLLTLAREAVAGAKRLVREIPLLTAEEERVLVDIWSGAGERGPNFMLLPEAVIKKCRACGPEIAVRAPSGQTTYDELLAGAAGTAKKLRSLGVTAGDVVGLFGPVNADWIAGCLGIMLARAIFLPLDPNQPDSRLKMILNDAAVAAVLCSRDNRDRLSQEILQLILDETTRNAQAWEMLEVGLLPEDPAYIIYTSGSTGIPKGVLVSHGSLGFHAAGVGQLFALSPKDRVLQFVAPGFDVSLEEIWPTLAAGGCVTICPPEVRESLDHFDLFMEKEMVTVANIPASFWEAWTEHLAAVNRRAPVSLRLLVTGSERVPSRWLPVWDTAACSCRILSGYGPTEATISATFYDPVRDGRWPDESSLPLGRPLPGVRVYVLDNCLRPVPPGCVGELCIAGPGVALGYRNSEEATAEVFLKESSVSAERLYRTGDLARFRPGLTEPGVLHFVGRKDDQIKWRGFRIEPGEVEAALLHLGDLHKAIVVLTENSLTALVQGEKPVDKDEFRHALAHRLPAYMLPDSIITVSELPALPGGKPDRRAALVLARRYDKPSEPASEPPLPGLEETLAEVWCEVLKAKCIGRRDNFFKLGGDSIRSLRVVSLARKRGLVITVRDMFQGPTLAELARLVRPEAVMEAGAAGPVQGEVPLTPMLSWIFSQPIEMKNNIVMVLPLRLIEPVKPEALLIVLTALMRHHHMLRARFDDSEGCTRLIIDPPDEASSLARKAIRMLDPGKVSLDLTAGPIFMVLQDPPDKLILLAHHVCVDPVSWSVILEDLETALHQVESGEDVALPDPTISFPEWARRSQTFADQPAQRNRTPLWQRICRDTRSFAQEKVPVDAADDKDLLEGEVLLSTRSLACSEELLVAALSLAVDQVCGRFPWLLELEGHGRDAIPGIDPSRTVGWFTTVTPARIDLDAVQIGFSISQAAAALLAGRQAVRGVRVLGANHGLLMHLCSDAEIRREMSELPAADVLLNYLGALLPSTRGRFIPTIGVGSDWFEPIVALGLPDTPPTHALEFNAMVTADGLRLAWRRDPRRLSCSLVDAILRLLPECLHQVNDAAARLAVSTPANYPLAWNQGLTFRGLHGIQKTLEVQGLMVADLHPLTPLQQGMLFHTLLDTEAGEYFDQLVCRVTFDPPAGPEHLRAAWERVVRRHPSLRSGVFWQGLDMPVQAVVRGWTLAWEELDWRSLDDFGHKAALEKLLDADRKRPFDLGHPPLQRLTLCRLDEHSWCMVWSNHHMILDGWSTPLVLQEVLGIADGLARGQDLRLAAASPFNLILAWQERQDRDSALDFWRNELDTFDEPTPLPLADRSLSESDWQRQARLDLSVQENEALQSGLRQHGWTLNSLVQGAWALLLSRYGGVRDVCFGASVSGRNVDVPGVERIVGCCIQTVPVRVRIDGRQIVTHWLTELREHQPEREHYGYLGIQEISGLADMPAGTPLFDTLVLVQTYPLGQKNQQRLVRLLDVKSIEYANYSITLVIEPAEDGLGFAMVFDPKRLSRAAADQLLVHLRTLMFDMITRPQVSLDTLEMLTSKELQRIHRDWNGAQRTYEYKGAVQGVFEQHVRRAPEAPAVYYYVRNGSDPVRVLSYGELDRRANRLAHVLQARGVMPDSYVGLCLPRTEDLLVGMLGILKAGGAYVPLDPDYPIDRLELILEETVPTVIVTHEGLLEQFPQSGKTQSFCLDRDVAELDHMPVIAPPCEVKPENAAFVIYTSGSTGLPKGVITLHRGMTNLVQLQTEHFDVTPKSRVLQFFSPSFDAATWEIFMALGSGAAIVMAEREALMPGLPLFELLQRARITHLTLTPSSLTVLPAPGPDDLPDLETLITGGEGCDYRLAERWAGGRRYFHGYGPTETTICCSAPRCLDFSGPLSLGRAHPNMRMLILDDRLQPCPVGVIGEICIGGVGVTRGYLNRGELTEDRFPLDPFAGPEQQAEGRRMYRSGDLGRWRDNGDIEFAGRIDHQVKVRGYRVEPGEIENVLTGLAIVESAVVVADHRAAGIRLLAYVTGRESLPDPLQILRELHPLLPAHMIPARIIPLERMPLTVNLKVDRDALPVPPDVRTSPVRVELLSPVQRQIADVWCELLELNHVAADDDFFELGGHSLLTVKVCSRLNEIFEADLSVAECYEYPTIQQLAKRLGDWDPQKASCKIVTSAMTPGLNDQSRQSRIEKPSWNKESQVETGGRSENEKKGLG